jgi:hypothetical protein
MDDASVGVLGVRVAVPLGRALCAPSGSPIPPPAPVPTLMPSHSTQATVDCEEASAKGAAWKRLQGQQLPRCRSLVVGRERRLRKAVKERKLGNYSVQKRLSGQLT